MKKILEKILAWLARSTVKKYKPLIIGVTGNVGKTSTREAVFAVLKNKYNIRNPEKNYNNEIGLPLTILGIKHHDKNILAWLKALWRAYRKTIFRDKKYPDILLLEYGVDRRGDMDHLLSIARPHVAVVTAIGDIPIHIEYFKNPKELAQEKGKLIQVLPKDGYAILNRDEKTVYELKEKTKAKVITYGFTDASDFKGINYSLRTVKDEKLGDVPDGLSFKIENKGNTVPIRLHNMFGEPSIYAALAAATVASIFNLNLLDIAESLAQWEPIPGRLRLLKGIKNSFILDDTYNAGPESTRTALDTLQTLPGARKIAILGDMLELGVYTEEAHRVIGKQTAAFVDLLVTVGSHTRFTAEEADRSGLSPDRILKFDDSETAAESLDGLIKERDLILVKGSQGIRMEKVVEGIMAHPEQAEKLLIRQDKYWVRNR